MAELRELRDEDAQVLRLQRLVAKPLADLVAVHAP